MLVRACSVMYIYVTQKSFHTVKVNISYRPVEVLVDVEGHGGVEGDEELVLDGDDSWLDGTVAHPPLLPQRDTCTRHTRNVRTYVYWVRVQKHSFCMYGYNYGTKCTL